MRLLCVRRCGPPGEPPAADCWSPADDDDDGDDADDGLDEDDTISGFGVLRLSPLTCFADDVLIFEPNEATAADSAAADVDDGISTVVGEIL